MPLEAATGTFDSEQLLAFTTLGLPLLNERTMAAGFLFLFINLAVFYLIPTFWIKGVFFVRGETKSIFASMRWLAVFAFTVFVGVTCAAMAPKAK